MMIQHYLFVNLVTLSLFWPLIKVLSSPRDMMACVKGMQVEVLPIPGSGSWGQSLSKPEHLSCKIGISAHITPVMWECACLACNHVLKNPLLQNLWPPLFKAQSPRNQLQGEERALGTHSSLSHLSLQLWRTRYCQHLGLHIHSCLHETRQEAHIK